MVNGKQHEKEFEKLSLVFGESYILEVHTQSDVKEALDWRVAAACMKTFLYQRRCVNMFKGTSASSHKQRIS